MASEALRGRVEKLRADFAKCRSTPFKHFFCPILFADDPVELCEGHIVPEAFGSATIPQRKDVDNFYGSATEADVGGWMEKRETIFENWHTHAVQKLVPVRFEANGKTLEYYIPKEPIEVPGHTLAQFIGADGKKVVDVMFKAPAHEVEALCGKEVQLVAERNFVPAMTGSILKAAHLTMFDMLGYDYVFSPTGQYLAAILREFFLSNKDKKNKRAAANAYFAAYASMVFPVMQNEIFGGTATDQKGILLWHERPTVRNRRNGQHEGHVLCSSRSGQRGSDHNVSRLSERSARFGFDTWVSFRQRDRRDRLEMGIRS